MSICGKATKSKMRAKGFSLALRDTDTSIPMDRTAKGKEGIT